MTHLSLDTHPEEPNERSPAMANLLWLIVGMAFIATPALLFC
ncbi:MAG: hypothetical protein RL375_1432 [Pseudomonadota bacterium]|jgi:hypothetical protein